MERRICVAYDGNLVIFMPHLLFKKEERFIDEILIDPKLYIPRFQIEFESGLVPDNRGLPKRRSNLARVTGRLAQNTRANTIKNVST